jgi:hypothetical protein
VYSLDDVVKAVKHPIFIAREMNILYHSRLRTRRFNPHGIDIFEEDWDNLIILDACRYDALRAVLPEYDLDGALESRISRGSATPEFLRGCFHCKVPVASPHVLAPTTPY